MRYFKRVIKKTTAVVLVTALLTTAADWSPISAATKEEELLVTESYTYPEEDALADNDELFAGYVQKAFLGDSGISLFSSSYAEKLLDSEELKLYNGLKENVEKIAKGEIASTIITTSDFALNKSTFPASFHRVISCLLLDCPYELYWYDKTTGVSYSYRTSGSSVNQVECKFTVADAYASGTYTTNTSKTGATTTAVNNAKAIVEANKDKSDYQKLVAYRDEICKLVSYNDAAASGSTTYGDPWQLIYVFDGNTSTNVVCEGYSKAFQYLCELSTFSGDVLCYTVTGGIPGAHMWNHVTIDGKNYLVDVTNCDDKTIGAPDNLFLKGMTGSIESGFSKDFPPKKITYTFDADSKELFGTGSDSILSLSSEDYVESTDAIQRVSVSSSEESLTWRYNTGATLTATPTLATGESGTPTYQWYKVSGETETAIHDATGRTYTMETGLAAGTYTYRVYASIGECKKSADIRVTVNPLELKASDLEFISSPITKSYDGTAASTAEVQIKAGVVDTAAVKVHGTAVYNSANVKEATKVIFTPYAITNGNYRLAATETIEHQATITRKTRTEVPPAPTAASAAIKDTEITLTTVTGCEYSKDGATWQDSPKFTGLTPNHSYTFHQRYKASDNVDASAESSAAITTSKTNLNGAVLTLDLPVGGYTYDGTEKKPAVTVTLNNTTVSADQYTVGYGNNKDAGTATVTITATDAGPYSGSINKTFSINKKVVTPSIEGTATKTYDSNKSYGGTALSIALTGVVSLDDVTATASSYTYDNETAGTNKKITASNITLTGTAAENYTLSSTTAVASVGTIWKANAEILVDAGSGTYSKNYNKNATFALSGITYKGDGHLVYTVSDSKYLSTDGSGNEVQNAVENDQVITVSADGKVTITGSGTATIKITSTAGTNYNAVENAAAKTITVSVAKATIPPYKPAEVVSADSNCATVGDVALSGEWKWTEDTKILTLKDDTPITATAVYTGADAKHYTTTSVSVQLTKADHTHIAGDILFTGNGEHAPTCVDDGIGHRECTVKGCGKTITSNVPVAALGHGLTAVAKKNATCTEAGMSAYWICSTCNKVFANKDGTAETTSSALIIPATGHAWKSVYTVDKVATATTAGSKSIHCTKCNAIKEGSSVEIPKTGTSSGGGSGSTVTTPTPKPTATPAPTKTPETTATPTPTKTPEATATPIPTKTPETTATPTKVPETSTTPLPTDIPKETVAPSPTKTPGESATPTANPKETAAPKPTKAPKVGNKIKDTKNVYTVTKVNKTKKNVAYKQPQSKKISSANIPKAVKIGGVTYKVTAIAANAFKNCKKLTHVTIGSNILNIQKNAFKNCKKLTKITIKSTKLTLKNIGKDAFKGINSKAIILVPAKKYKAYKKLLRKCGVAASVKIRKY